MKAHHVVDVLKGNQSQYKLVLPSIPHDRRTEFVQWCEAIADVISSSQHFVFENLPIHTDKDGLADTPGVTEEEREMFAMGLLPLPFESCWFEAPVVNVGVENAQETMAWHLREDGDRSFVATPIRVAEGRNGKWVIITGEQWRVSRGQPGEPLPPFQYIDTFGCAADFMDEMTASAGGKVSTEGIVQNGVGFIMYLLLMLSSKSTEISEHVTPEKLNRRRKARGKSPLPDHRIVSIIPRSALREYRDQEREMLEAGSRSSPRIHWRRSHVRTLADGRRIVVARALVGYRKDPDREMVPHSYRVRSDA